MNTEQINYLKEAAVDWSYKLDNDEVPSKEALARAMRHLREMSKGMKSNDKTPEAFLLNGTRLAFSIRRYIERFQNEQS